MTKIINENPEKLDPGFWIGVILLILFIVISVNKCNAQQYHRYDTIPCQIECIKKFVTSNNTKTEKIYAIYTTKDISDLIPVNKTVFQYICECRRNGIEPSLGIRLKDGQLLSIIRYKKKYIIKR